MEKINEGGGSAPTPPLSDERLEELLHTKIGAPRGTQRDIAALIGEVRRWREQDAREEKYDRDDAVRAALAVSAALRDLIDVVSSDGDEPRKMRPAVAKAVEAGLHALKGWR